MALNHKPVPALIPRAALVCPSPVALFYPAPVLSCPPTVVNQFLPCLSFTDPLLSCTYG